MEAVKHSTKELHLRCYSGYEKQECISVILLHVEASINGLKILKNYLWRSSYLTNEPLSRLSFGQIVFQEGTSYIKGFTKYIPEHLHWAVHYFVIISWNS